MYLNEGKTYTKQEIKSSEMRNVNNKKCTSYLLLNSSHCTLYNEIGQYNLLARN